MEEFSFLNIPEHCNKIRSLAWSDKFQAMLNFIMLGPENKEKYRS
jgi:hypothetical protein